MQHSKFTISSLILLLAFSTHTFGQVCLSPGQFKDDFVFSSQVVNNSLTRMARLEGTIFEQPAEPVPNPGALGQALVAFEGQNIKIDASASNPLNFFNKRRIEAFARGKLFFDFAVCGGQPNDTITVAIAFKVKRVGRITTFLPSSTSSFGVSARIRDTVENRDVDFRTIENQAVGNLLGNFKTIAKVPIPIPEVQTAELANTETFVVQLRRGRMYRFELFAAARSISGHTIQPLLTPFATANFYDPVIDLGINGTPGVEIVDFWVDVAADQSSQISALSATVASLQQSLAQLSELFAAVDPSLGSRMTDIEDSNSLASERIAVLEEARMQSDARIAELTVSIDQLTSVIVELQAAIAEAENHTHEFPTSRGRGQNDTTDTTGPPVTYAN